MKEEIKSYSIDELQLLYNIVYGELIDRDLTKEALKGRGEYSRCLIHNANKQMNPYVGAIEMICPVCYPSPFRILR